MSLSIKFCEEGGLCFWRVGAADDRVTGSFDDLKAQPATFFGDEKHRCFAFWDRSMMRFQAPAGIFTIFFWMA
jgi:hypothetical protein